ncbi:MAG: ABC transporter permease [Alphaproteobacteria bacterium]|nr:ABC transporter permease [Alphaproteobacteria bacterium]
MVVSRLRPILEDKGAMAGLGVILLFCLMALLAPWIAPHDPTTQNVRDAFQGPGARYWFGTDEFGRDVFSRVIHGARPALMIGVFSVVLSVVLGMPLGMLAGFVGGRFDTAVSAVVDVMMSFPSLLLALMVVTLLGSAPSMVVLAIGISHVPVFVRLARSSTLVVRELDFVAASRSFGARTGHILRRHVMPNVIGPTIVMATLGIAGAIREEAGLSFLGLGIQPPAPSWGNLIRDGVNAILHAPTLALLPGLVLTASVLAFNIVGDSVRDMLDPHDIAAAAAKRDRAR